MTYYVYYGIIGRILFCGGDVLKKAISCLLAIVMLVSSFGAVSAYAKTTALVALQNIQTTTGFVPGKSSKVQGNCYGFISAVCEKLFGVGYNGEGLYSNYLCKHETGNYYTVATYKNTSSSMSTSTATEIKNFFINNAMPGDIIHYGTLTSGTSNSATHTFMIQSIDSTKMRIYHSNYETSDYARSTCHIDDIVWSSFLSAPTKTQYNSNGNMTSLNAIFYNKMKSGGLGISINRYTKYGDMYTAVYPTVPSIILSYDTSSSIKAQWGKIENATKYQLQYKKTSDTSYTTFSSTITANNCVITGLTTGTEYDIRARAYVGGAWKAYSQPVSMKALPPVVSSFKYDLSDTGIVLSWKASKDATGYYIYRSDTENGTYKKIKTISNSTTLEHVDKTIANNKSYFYKIESYKTVGSSTYKNATNPIKATYFIANPRISISRASTTGLKLTFAGDDITTKIVYSLYDSEENLVVSGETMDVVTVKNLNIGEKYICYAYGENAVGISETAKAQKQVLPPTPSYINLTVSKDGITISYPTRKDVDGYNIYRSTSEDGEYEPIAQVDDCTISSYLDTTVKYGQPYFYKVQRYVIFEENVYAGANSAPSTAALKINKINDLKATSASNTSIKLTWSQNDMATRYKISYRIKGEKEYLPAVYSATNSIKIKGLTLGTTYEFKIRGENSYGNGAYSSFVTKRSLPMTPKKPTAKKVKSGIKVSWQAYSTGTGYKIYRKTSKNGKYTLVKTITSKKTLSFTDKNVKKGKTYYYSVVNYKTSKGTTYNSGKSTAISIKF